MSGTYHKTSTDSALLIDKLRESRDERAQTYEKEVALAKLKSQESLQLATIEAKSKEEVKRIESEGLRAKALAEKEVYLQAQQIQKEIAASKEQTVVLTQEKDLSFYKIVIAVVTVLVLVLLLIYFLIHRKNKLIEVKLHEEKLRHEASMQANAHHHEKIGRMLEIIADENLNEHVRHTLIDILKGQESNQNLITHHSTEEVQEEK